MRRLKIADDAVELAEMTAGVNLPKYLAELIENRNTVAEAEDELARDRRAAAEAVEALKRSQPAADFEAVESAVEAGSDISGFELPPSAVPVAEANKGAVQRKHDAVKRVLEVYDHRIADEIREGDQFERFLGRVYAKALQPLDPSERLTRAEHAGRAVVAQEQLAAIESFLKVSARYRGANPRELAEIQEGIAARSPQLPTLDAVSAGRQSQEKRDRAATEAIEEARKEAADRAQQERTKDRRRQFGLDDDEEEAA